MKKLLFLSIFVGFLLSFPSVKADFLDSSFWAGSPTDNQIETALFATDSSYTQNRTGYSTACSISSVVHLSAGTDMLPVTLSPNTIYVLDAGTYISSYQINLSDCSAIVGNGEVIMQSTIQLAKLFFGSGISNIIFDNFQIDGKTLHTGTPNTFGLEILGNSKNITFNTLDVYGNAYGVVLRNTQYMNIFSSKSHNNSSDGFYLNSMNRINISNIGGYNNTGNGISIYYSNYINIEKSNFFGNVQHGIMTQYLGYSIIKNSSTYNNGDIGINVWHTYYNLIYNCNIYNNRRGMHIGHNGSNSFNNINIFNNFWGIYVYGNTNDIFDNVSLFNNDYGIYTEDDAKYNFFNNMRIYNNSIGINFDYYWNIFKNLPSYGNKYYNTFSMFSNTNNFSGLAIDFPNISIRSGYQTLITKSKIETGFVVSGTTYDGYELLVAGTSGMNYLGRTTGKFDTTPIFDSSWLIEPINASGVSFFAGMPTNKIGRNLSWQSSNNVNYIYGKSISKQTAPLIYSGTTFVLADIPWNYAVYVGRTWDPDFYLIDKSYITGTSISSFITDANTFVGEDSLDPGLFTGSSFPYDIIMQSTGTNKIETFINSGVHFKQANGISNYIGNLSVPIELNGNTASELQGQYIASVVNIGSSTDTILFKDGSGNDTNVTVHIPVPGLSIGNPVTVFYSSDGSSWNSLTTSNVIDIDGTPYVEFDTTHFTYFAVSGGTGSFVINNDAVSTSSQIVNLNMSTSGVVNMRFANTIGELATASWETYSGSKSWILSNDFGSKTVYAEFDTDGNTGTIEASSSDLINYIKGPIEGQISLEILSGVSQCIYGTSLSLGNQDVKFDTGYTFTGDFGSGEWSCTDYKAGLASRTFTIQSSDLSNGKGNSISATGIEINHSAGTRSGDPKCTAGYASGSTWALINTPYTIMERKIEGQQTCKVTIPMVNLKIGVGANQAPGTYSGTLTLTLQGI